MARELLELKKGGDKLLSTITGLFTWIVNGKNGSKKEIEYFVVKGGLTLACKVVVEKVSIDENV